MCKGVDGADGWREGVFGSGVVVLYRLVRGLTL